MASVQTQTEA